MISDCAEIVLGTKVEACGPIKRRNQIPLEEICASGEGDGVWYGGFEDFGVVGEEVEGFCDCVDGGIGNCFYEGFDGGDGHGKVGVGSEN